MRASGELNLERSILADGASRRVEVVCVGETMVSLVPADSLTLAKATQLGISVAGGESNVACYLADLGHSVQWCSRLGSDPFGDRILQYLQAARVGTRFVVRSKAPTGVMFKDPGSKTTVHYRRRGSAASGLSMQDFRQYPLSDSAILHLTGVTPALSRSTLRASRGLVRLAARAGTVTSFDVNYRPKLWADRRMAARVLLRMSRAADIVFVGRDEARSLWGTESEESIRHLLGTRSTLVVKDGERGATEFPRGETDAVFVGALKVDVVEPVGAGDAFAAGFLSALLRGRDSAGRLMLGHRLAALALSSTQDHVTAMHLRLPDEG